jgi:hypothetical protein
MAEPFDIRAPSLPRSRAEPVAPILPGVAASARPDSADGEAAHAARSNTADGSSMRKLLSFCCAIGLMLGSAYALYFFLFEAHGYQFIWVGAAGVFLFVSLNWLWEDFIGPI